MPRHTDGFTLVELLIALTLLGFVASMVIPRLLTTAGDNEVRTRVSQTFTVVGEAYNSFKKDDAVVNNPAALTDPNTFYSYLHQNTNFLEATAPSAATTVALCTIPGNYMRFHNGAILRQICPHPIAAPQGLLVQFDVPVRDGGTTTTRLRVAIHFDTDNYTTKRGYALINNISLSSNSDYACTKSDFLLNVDASCNNAPKPVA